jgi:hypothetical protein
MERVLQYFVELRPHALSSSLSMIITEFIFMTVRKTSFEIKVIAQMQKYVFLFKTSSNTKGAKISIQQYPVPTIKYYLD